MQSKMLLQLIKQNTYVLFYVMILTLMSSSYADSFQLDPLRGHIKLQQQYAASDSEDFVSTLGYKDVQTSSLDARLQLLSNNSHWTLAADYLLNATHGNSVTLQSDITALFPELQNTLQRRQWFDLEHINHLNSQSIITHRLDRFYFKYSSENTVIKFGRQALSWGNGLIFRPMDLFNPFAPDAIDTSYKTGSDMIYTQYLLKNGGDISGLVVPRRNQVDHQLHSDESAAAVKWHYPASTYETDFVLGKDYDDLVLALGISSNVNESIWRFDIVPVFFDKGGSRTSIIMNIDTAWSWLGRNIYGLLEYYRNGFGSAHRNLSMQEWSIELTDRLARGQIFTSGRDYLASTLRIEISPLLLLSPLIIMNLNDQSALLSLQGEYSLQQDMNISFGTTVGLGSDGTEYGGIETFSGSGTYNPAPNRFHARLEMFF